MRLTRPHLLAALAADPDCTWCGGSGEVTDPEGRTWPCIKCRPVDPGPW